MNSEKQYDRKFRRKSFWAFLRGKFQKNVTRIDNDRQLLIGKNVESSFYGSGRIVLKNSSHLDGSIGSFSPTYLSCSSIGFEPSWKFLNPPAFSKTKLRLRIMGTILRRNMPFEPLPVDGGWTPSL